eukprot:TRINITY_DN4886_c0_g1_i2.p2 TRINITY_DN4886_c0_g1~~TRINITY_DN4886_c0_g1_i2.p2  ORF type:complete len:107 (+),score=15.59 TRINITY_DN4886_c0_g1_i2:234-554(+)
MANNKYEYVKSFEPEDELMPLTWIVVRIDGHRFHSFILKKTTQLCQRHSSKILSLIVSYFTSAYVMKWREFFPQKELKYPPSFDGRVICYPSTAIVRDYLAWRQVT